MDRRTLLAVMLSVLVYLGWMVFFGPRPTPRHETDDLPATGEVASRGTPEPPTLTEPERPSTLDDLGSDVDEADTTDTFAGGETTIEELITVRTPLYEAVFSNRGGGLVRFTTLGYDDPGGQPLVLVDTDVAQPVLRVDPDGEGGRAALTLEETIFSTRAESSPELEIAKLVFTTTGANGAHVERHYAFDPDYYTIDSRVEISGVGRRADGHYTLSWTDGLPVTEEHQKGDLTEFAALARIGENIERKGLDDFSSEFEGQVRWAATRTKYFISALFVQGGGAEEAALFGEKLTHRVGWAVTSELVEGAAGDGFVLYVGPIEQDRLTHLGEGIDSKIGIRSNMFLGAIFGWLARLVYEALNAIHAVIPNYGIAIILVALITKLLFFPLTRKGTASMKRMSALKPEIERIQEKYKGDQQKVSLETMALYKKHGVNPAAGCLPLLIQMPVFFALYGVLRNAIELRQAPFLFWINDLSAPDTLVHFGQFPMLPDALHVLPLVMAASTILMQKTTAMMTDPRQKSLMYLMPVMMLFFFYSMPAGLNLYWTVQNLFTWAEQAITRGDAASKPAKAA